MEKHSEYHFKDTFDSRYSLSQQFDDLAQVEHHEQQRTSGCEVHANVAIVNGRLAFRDGLGGR